METELPVRDPTCLYLYGIVPAAPLELSAVKGVEGGCDVSLVGFEDLACAVSPVPLSEYGEQGMTAHAQELDWTAPRALRHQDVVQRLRQAGPVIPLKFGVLCSTAEKVRELLQKHHQPLLRLLEVLRGREEWGVRVYADPDLASRALEGAGPGRLRDQPGDLPGLGGRGLFSPEEEATTGEPAARPVCFRAGR